MTAADRVEATRPDSPSRDNVRDPQWLVDRLLYELRSTAARGEDARPQCRASRQLGWMQCGIESLIREIAIYGGVDVPPEVDQ